MSIRVYIKEHSQGPGGVRLPEEARVSVFDRGFLYGDSVYETIATAHGRLFALDEHLTRLERSAGRIGLRTPPRAEMERAIADTMAAAGNPESRVRIMVTRGVGTLDLDPASADDPQLVVLVFPLNAPSPEMYARGVPVAIVSVTRNSPQAIDPAVKSGNYLNNVLAVGEARRAGAYEAILCAADGSVAEGASSNVFVVDGGVVRTPPLSVGILDGITRGKVIELCRANRFAVSEERISPDQLRGAAEVFITSATRSILPVTRVDDRSIGKGLPGPVTRRLMDLFAELVRYGGNK
ncbi:MAG TPA: aminotransferase class IV [Polyangia bacterium]|jgi:branched-chain amino acid aminotransferase|nr:aminotransferase class IV [Polyangia bacterium]